MMTCGQVRVWDQDPCRLDTLPQQLALDREAAAEAGLVRGGSLGEVSCLSQLDLALSGATIVIEAVAEELEAKTELMRRVAEVAAEDAVLASSTLRLDLGQIFSQVSRPGRCLGLRFLFPVLAIPEVEVSPW